MNIIGYIKFNHAHTVDRGDKVDKYNGGQVIEIYEGESRERFEEMTLGAWVKVMRADYKGCSLDRLDWKPGLVDNN